MKEIYVINSRGEREPFSAKKVYRGIRKSGGGKELAKQITKIIQKEAFPGIRTCEIAKRIGKFLFKKSPREAIKFNLKEGMLKLGPAGFLFENYIGEIFSDLGYKVKLNLHLQGASSARYEIDFLAKKPKTFYPHNQTFGVGVYLGECKYHHRAGGRVDLGVTLMNYARYLDLKKPSMKSIIVTNTKFTTQAIKYSEYQGVLLLGWKHPKKRGLEILIEKRNLYPITILPSLDLEFKDIFVKAGKILVKDILKISPQKFSKKYKIPLWKLNQLIKEAEILLG